jgi:hypothetical protein
MRRMNRSSISGLFALGIVALGASGCGNRGVAGSGTPKTETRAIADVTEVQLDGVGALEIADAPTASLTVTADDNVLPILTTNVSGGKLTIATSKSVRPKTPIVYRLSGPNIHAIALRGAADVHASALHGDDLTVTLAGTGNVAVGGTAKSLHVRLSGAGNIDAAALVVKDAHVDVSGVGDAIVNATDSLDVDVTGAGSVHYRGAPRITKRVSGVGSVQSI